MNPLTVRFYEVERYDILNDCEVVQFMATTNTGTYHCEVEVDGPKTLREMRKEFQDLAIQYIQSGANPCYIDLDGRAS